MQSLNYYQLFQELISHYPDKEIVVEIRTFNKFVKEIRSHNIICDFDYYDLENYAHSLPDLTRTEYSKLIFYPTTEWIRDVEYFSRLYTVPTNHIKVIEIWEEIIK